MNRLFGGDGLGRDIVSSTTTAGVGTTIATATATATATIAADGGRPGGHPLEGVADGHPAGRGDRGRRAADAAAHAGMLRHPHLGLRLLLHLGLLLHLLLLLLRHRGGRGDAHPGHHGGRRAVALSWSSSHLLAHAAALLRRRGDGGQR